MKKILSSLFIALLLLSIWSPRQIYAATCTYEFEPKGPTADRPVKFIISNPEGFNQADRYRLRLTNTFGADDWISGFFTPINGKLEFQAGGRRDETKAGTHTISVRAESDNQDRCTFTYTIKPQEQGCNVVREPKGPGVGQSAKLTFSNLALKQGVNAGWGRWFAEITPRSSGSIKAVNEKAGGVEVVTGDFKSEGSYTVTLKGRSGLSTKVFCQTIVRVAQNPGDQSAYTLQPGESQPTSPSEIKRCGDDNSGLSTALGCIPVGDTNSFVGWFLKWALGISGGVAFLLIIFAGFQIMSSTGNPDKIQGGKELLNAAISGLILIIFSVFLLKLIGVDILGLPGF
ncbi:MAG: hypothetical protein HYW33_04145 [Candidatus Blackburnbacteria bacterium]|nr:hypothetical protein [Candidatus Blackburnbacteria bacterium]